MLKDKKVLAGGAVLFLAAFWFYIKPNYMDAKPAPPITQEQIAASPHPTVMLGKEVTLAAHAGNAPEGLVLNLKAPANTPRYVNRETLDRGHRRRPHSQEHRVYPPP